MDNNRWPGHSQWDADSERAKDRPEFDGGAGWTRGSEVQILSPRPMPTLKISAMMPFVISKTVSILHLHTTLLYFAYLVYRLFSVDHLTLQFFHFYRVFYSRRFSNIRERQNTQNLILLNRPW
jgi:hypothetical protein